MPPAPKISVCVPMFNKALHADHCLRTILARGVEGMELVIFDNGSTDGSTDIAARLAREDSRVRHIRLEHTIMIQESWRMAFLHSHGELLKLQSANDELHPDFFDEMLPPFADPVVEYTLCKEQIEVINVPILDAPRMGGIYDKFNDFCKMIVAIPDRVERARALVCNTCGMNSMGNLFKVVFRRRCLPLERWKAVTAAYPVPTSYPDWDFLIRLLLNHRGHFVDKILYHYRITPDAPITRIQSNDAMKISDSCQLLFLIMTVLGDPLLAPLRQTLAPDELQQLHAEALKRVTTLANQSLTVDQSRPQAGSS